MLLSSRWHWNLDEFTFHVLSHAGFATFLPLWRLLLPQVADSATSKAQFGQIKTRLFLEKNAIPFTQQYFCGALKLVLRLSYCHKNKLIKTNKSLHIPRKLRKEGYNQLEIDLLFNACKCSWFFLERQDRKFFRKVSNTKGHQLLSITPRVKLSSYNPRKETCFKLRLTLWVLKTHLLTV